MLDFEFLCHDDCIENVCIKHLVWSQDSVGI